MISFLLIISFLLHIVAFIAIYQLYKQTQLPKQESTSEDMIELFDMYLAEIKEENKHLEKVLSDKEQTKPTKQNYKTPLLHENLEQEKETHSYTLPEVEDDVRFETSLQAKILQMHDQGMSNEEIARKLNSGKTEVDLIVKLHAKN